MDKEILFAYCKWLENIIIDNFNVSDSSSLYTAFVIENIIKDSEV